MPWSDAPNGGFSSHRPWLRMAPDAATRNVARQAADPESVLSLYRRLIWLRRAHPALQVGTYRRLAASRDVFAWVRATDTETLAVAVNFGRGAGWVAPGAHPGGSGWRQLLGTQPTSGERISGGGRLELRPYEAVVLGGA
jgi:alpha-glucosidase